MDDAELKLAAEFGRLLLSGEDTDLVAASQMRDAEGYRHCLSCGERMPKDSPDEMWWHEGACREAWTE
jgi:hypothetical protein